MLRGELHNRGSAGRCEACGEIFPCPTGLAIYEAVKRELEHPTPLAQTVASSPEPPIAKEAKGLVTRLLESLRAGKYDYLKNQHSSDSVPSGDRSGPASSRSAADRTADAAEKADVDRAVREMNDRYQDQMR